VSKYIRKNASPYRFQIMKFIGRRTVSFWALINSEHLHVRKHEPSITSFEVKWESMTQKLFFVFGINIVSLNKYSNKLFTK